MLVRWFPDRPGRGGWWLVFRARVGFLGLSVAIFDDFGDRGPIQFDPRIARFVYFDDRDDVAIGWCGDDRGVNAADGNDSVVFLQCGHHLGLVGLSPPFGEEDDQVEQDGQANERNEGVVQQFTEHAPASGCGIPIRLWRIIRLSQQIQ